MKLHASADELLEDLAEHDLEAVTDTLARVRTAIGDDPHGIDPEHHALLITAHIYERKVRPSRRLRRQVTKAPACVSMLDSDMHILAISQQFAELLGYQPRDLVGRSVLPFSVLSDREVRKQTDRLQRHGRVVDATGQVRARDGHMFEFTYNARRMRINGATVYLIIGHPVEAAAPTRLHGLDESRPWVGAVAASAMYGCWACDLAPRLGGTMLEPV